MGSDVSNMNAQENNIIFQDTKDQLLQIKDTVIIYNSFHNPVLIMQPKTLICYISQFTKPSPLGMEEAVRKTKTEIINENDLSSIKLGIL